MILTAFNDTPDVEGGWDENHVFSRCIRIAIHAVRETDETNLAGGATTQIIYQADTVLHKSARSHCSVSRRELEPSRVN